MLTIPECKRAIRSLMLHRLRSFLSTLGILFGVAAVIAMHSIGEGAKQETLEQIKQLGMSSILIRTIAQPEKKDGLTWKDMETLTQNIPVLRHNAALKVIEASLTGAQLETRPEILAVTRAFGEIKGLHLAEGRFICDLDQHQRTGVCVLGYEIAKSLGREGHIGNIIRLDKIPCEVVGILSPTQWRPGKNAALTARNLDHAIFIPLGMEQSLGGSSLNGDLSEIVLQLQDSHQMAMAAPLVKKMMAKMHGGLEDYQVIIPLELLEQAAKTQHLFNLVLGSIAAISLLVGGIGIMNIMLATVSERTREIGIRRAIGASRSHILRQFLVESVLLTIVGGICGAVVGIIASFAIHKFAGWETIVTSWSIILSFFMASVVGLGSGLYPAYQAAMKDPVAALRGE